MTIVLVEYHLTMEKFPQEDFLISIVVRVKFDIDKYCKHSIVMRRRLRGEKEFGVITMIVQKKSRSFFFYRLACLLTCEDYSIDVEVCVWMIVAQLNTIIVGNCSSSMLR